MLMTLHDLPPQRQQFLLPKYSHVALPKKLGIPVFARGGFLAVRIGLAVFQKSARGPLVDFRLSRDAGAGTAFTFGFRFSVTNL